jgi:hypothetical protein
VYQPLVGGSFRLRALASCTRHCHAVGEGNHCTTARSRRVFNFHSQQFSQQFLRTTPNLSELEGRHRSTVACILSAKRFAETHLGSMACKGSGVRIPLPPLIKYLIRRYFLLLAQGVKLQVVSEVLGHSDSYDSRRLRSRSGTRATSSCRRSGRTSLGRTRSSRRFKRCSEH